MESGLYVVATPIGNLEDISRRALATLGAVDMIAAEDTRHSQRLLQHYAIDTPLMAYHDHSDDRAVAKILATLARGGSVALVSDAGTPLVSDPGYRLVRAVQDQGHPVHPLPGPCAAIAALSAAGLPTDRFLFEGFLPAREGARNNRLARLAREPATLVFYEAPHRLTESLAAMVECLGPQREAVLARELSKAFETVKRDSLEGLHQLVQADSNQRRGEIVLLVAGWRESGQEFSEELAALLRRLARELPAKTAAAVVAEWSGVRKKVLYDYLLAHRES
ncbi:MAG: 16S rRNA (cytidine(1402)-2'-O)-methyltransferase [Halieaceae bacterium]|nr:16S rRNA (cytidine(1402)-2'-O)-methyltransferase [Halieaceae bacterium]MCP5204773.1 16S rRNA (cytidine(1402)-2'-O)-methyltransferase [Pseudomonadales bacterium]